jgi:hypothetical protein
MENYLLHFKLSSLSKIGNRGVIITLSLFFMAFFQGYGQVSGNVFNDNNSNGIRNFLRPNEKAIQGATVKAFVGTSTTPITKTTDASGNYSFSTGEIPAGSKARIEFASNIPYSNSGLTGATSQSTIQFVTAPATNISLGFLEMEDYCQYRPPYFAIPCYVTGDPLISTGDVTKDAGEGDALVAFDYMATGIASATNFPPVHLGLAKDIGAVWGITFHGRSNTVISAAIVKRHAGLGTLGTGGLYKTNATTGIALPYLDVKTIGINTGPDPHVGLPADKNIPSKDSLTFSKVGKVGIGGTDISVDGKAYFMSNLYDKKVYRINIGKDLNVLPTAAGVRAYTIPNGGCSNNEYSTWAVTCDGPDVYVGVNCTAETSQTLSDLKAVIYKLDTTSGVFTQMLSFPLDFIRGSADRTGLCVNNKTWKPWTNTFPAPCDGNFVMHPQPILSDVYFDNNGHMLLGFMDRFGHQAGVQMPNLSGNGSYQAFMGGDLMRAYRNPDNSFSLENNGTAGPLVGCGVENGQGIGGGEFFADDAWKFFGNVAHDEVLNGGLLVVPGYDEVLSTSFDPIDEVFMSSGWQVYNVNTGKALREFAVFGETDVKNPYVRNGTFGKAAALGSGRAMCDLAPIEVGNRIWIDTNVDGIQDPNELGIDGIEVLICDATTNQVVGKDTTSNGGRYYFNSRNVITNATNKGLDYEKNYVIKIAKNQPALARFQRITSKDAGTSDLIDSDGQEDATNIFVTFRTGDVGETNHNFDFGLIECLKLDSLVITKCDVWTNTYRAKVYVAYNNSPKKNIHIVLKKPDGTILKDSIFVPSTTANHQLITLADLSSNGLAGMKISINVVGSEADVKCKIDTTYRAPAQCTTPIPGQFLDPMGYIFCEETGQIIKGATVEVLGPKPAIILENGSQGEYRFMIAPNAYGVYTLKINLPAGYTASSTCLASNDTLKLAGKPNPYLLGNPANADSTFMTSTACTVFYKKFDIQFGDPIARFNNIPLKGCCIKPIAGADTSLCSANTTTINLKDAATRQFWKPVAGNPTAASIDSLTGVASGLTMAGKYQFQLIFGLANSTCRDTIAVMVATKPNFTATTSSPTCTDGTPISNGSITLLGFGASNRAGYSLGSTYSGASSYATAAVIPASGIIVANLPSPTTATQAYTVRVFNSTGCFKDTTISISKATINCCTVLPKAGNDTSFCLLSSTTVNLIDAQSGELWSASATNPAGSSITATTGVVTGLSSVGTYKFILSNTLGGQSCRDTVVIKVVDKPVFTATASSTSCLNDMMQANGKLTLAAFDPAERYVYTPGSTYTGIVATYAAATAIPSTGIIAANLTNPTTASQDYTIRVFNATGCYKDVTVQLMKATTVCEKGSIGDFVWKDTNNDGVQDAGEVGVGNIQIELYKNGTLFAKDTTDASGKYLFSGLNAGTYKIKVLSASIPAACLLSLKSNVGNDAKDSDVNATTGESGDYIIDPTDSTKKDILTVDAALYTPKGSIGDFIWKDSDNDGIQDAGEPGVSGVIIELIKNGTPVKRDTTDTNGKYLFDNLDAGLYKVKILVGSLPAGCIISSKKDSPFDDNLDSDFDPATGITGDYEINFLNPAKTLISNVDGALYSPKGVFGDFIWKDSNNNGIQDAGEPGVAGVQVELYKNGVLIAKDTTDASGKYMFTNLDAGAYKIKVLAASFPASCLISPKQNIGDDSKDSDISPTTGESDVFALDPTDPTKKDILTVDAALYTPKGSIGDFIWKDSDNDGIQDTGEPGVSGVIIELIKNGTPVKRDTTDTNGKYSFDNLDAGLYKVKILTNSLPAGCIISSKKDSPFDDNLDSDFDPATGITGDYEINFLNPNKTFISDVDGALYSPKGVFGDFIWKDSNNNGIQDAGEPGVAGVQVELYKNGVLIAKDTTDASGKYMFTNLDAGAYKIKVLAASFPASCLISPKQNIGDDSKDSDISPTTGESDVFALDPTDPTKKDILNVDGALYTPQLCVQPFAGKDTTVCGLDITTIDLRNAIGSERWAIVAGNPAPAAIDELSGVVSNLLVDGTYKFQLKTSGTCSDTISVTVGMKPTFTAVATKATCVNGTPISNGMITLSNFTAGNRFAYVKGSSYNGTVANYATATAIPASGIIATNLLNPSTATEDYTIRVFNTTGCYSDLTVKLQKETLCCVPVCVPFVITRKLK